MELIPSYEIQVQQVPRTVTSGGFFEHNLVDYRQQFLRCCAHFLPHGRCASANALKMEIHT